MPTNTEERNNKEEEDKDESSASILEESNNEGNDSSSPHDPFYPPIISLPEVPVDSGEGDEDVVFVMRAKLFRYSSSSSPPEWKERGTGDVKLLRHRETDNLRLLMRRDKTLKTCANHRVQPWMQLRPNCGSDRAFVWSVQADFADGEAKPEMLAIRFSNADNAAKFKAKFEECVKEVTRREASKLKEEEEEKLSDMVRDKAKVTEDKGKAKASGDK